MELNWMKDDLGVCVCYCNLGSADRFLFLTSLLVRRPTV
jgi:hypothetical protein